MIVAAERGRNQRGNPAARTAPASRAGRRRAGMVNPPTGSGRAGSPRRMAPSMHVFVEAAVATVYGIAPSALRRRSRGVAKVAFARQVAMYVCHVRLGLNLTEVGRAFGRDRTTAAHACRLVEERRDDPEMDRVIGWIEAGVESWRRLTASLAEAE